MLLYERAPNFEALGLSPEACDGMERIRPGIPPGRFMSWVLPQLIAGRDIIGTVRDVDYKKTIAAYLVTIFEKFNKHRGSHGGVRALILTATGDMASRTFDLAQKLFSSTDIVVVYLNGGENELERLDHQKPDAVIVTPDTLIHHLSSSSSSAAADDGILSLRSVGLLVIDGAYEMLRRLGFVDHLQKILGQLGELDRQTLLFTTQSTAAVCILAKIILRNNPFSVRPTTTHEMFDKVLSLCSGEVKEKPCVEKPNTILQQDTPPPPPTTRHCSDDAKKEKMMKEKKKKNKKRATHDGIEEAGSCKKRARNSMDVD